MSLMENILEHHLVKYFGLYELARMQAVSTPARGVLSDCAAWHSRLSAAVPSLDVARGVLAADNRCKLAQYFPAFLASHFSPGTLLSIPSVEEAARFGRLLKAASRAPVDGGVTCATIAVLKFPGGTLAEALGGGAGGVAAGLCRSVPIGLAASPGLEAVLGSPGGSLRVQFAWSNRDLLVKVRGSPGGNRALSLGLAVRHPALTLDFRASTPEVGGRWEPMGAGLASVDRDQPAAIRALTEGVPCAVVVHQGGGGPTVTPNTSLAHALHLDEICLNLRSIPGGQPAGGRFG